MPFKKGHTFWKSPEAIKHQFKKGNIPPYIKHRRTAVCPVCSSTFKSTKFCIEKRNRKYCSRKCYVLDHKGKNVHNWKGGIIIRKKINKRGIVINRRFMKVYNYHNIESYSPYIRISRLNVETSIGRYLLPHEIVHHIDGNTLNDNIDNLMLLQSNKEHRLLHVIR